MSDPFQNVDDAGINFAEATAETMEIRQSEPVMERIVSNYLNELEFKHNSLTVEIGCGAGSISRRIAQHAGGSKVLGFDPSNNYIEMAQKYSKSHKNLTFSATDGKPINRRRSSRSCNLSHRTFTRCRATLINSRSPQAFT